MTQSTIASPAGRQEPADIIDFMRSIPPVPPILSHHLAEALPRVGGKPQSGLLLRDAVPGGSADDRRVGALWLRPRFRSDIPPERIIVTNGTQSAILLLLEGLVGQNGLLLAECLSYGVIADLARRAHVRIAGLAIDDEGIVPEAFEDACRRDGPKALYCNPTDHNPTTSVASESRRLALAAIARRHGVPIIEDDPLGRLDRDAPPAIAALASDIAWHVGGLTKCLAHGLRVAYLVAPSAADLDRVVGPARRLSHWFAAPLMTALVADWIMSGAAEAICAAIREETGARRRIALGILEKADLRCGPSGMHGWLRLPEDIRADAFAARLAERGVLVRPAGLFAVGEGQAPQAVRLSLSAPPDRQAVERGLERVAALLASPA